MEKPVVGKVYKGRFVHTNGEKYEDMVPMFVSASHDGKWWMVTYRKASGPFVPKFTRVARSHEPHYGCVEMRAV